MDKFLGAYGQNIDLSNFTEASVEVKDKSNSKRVIGKQKLYCKSKRGPLENVIPFEDATISLICSDGRSPFFVDLHDKTFIVKWDNLPAETAVSVEARLKEFSPSYNKDRNFSSFQIESLSIDASGNLTLTMPMKDKKKFSIVVDPVSLSIVDTESKNSKSIFSTADISKNFTTLDIAFPKAFTEAIVGSKKYRDADLLDIEFETLPLEIFDFVKKNEPRHAFSLEKFNLKLIKSSQKLFIQSQNRFVSISKKPEDILLLEKEKGFDLVFVQTRNKEGKITKGLRVDNISSEDIAALEKFGVKMLRVTKGLADEQLFTTSALKTTKHYAKVDFFSAPEAEAQTGGREQNLTPPVNPEPDQNPETNADPIPPESTPHDGLVNPEDGNDENDNSAERAGEASRGAGEAEEKTSQDAGHLAGEAERATPHAPAGQNGASGAPDPSENAAPSESEEDKRKKKLEEAKKARISAIKSLITNVGKIIGLVMFIIGIGVGPVVGMNLAIIGFALYSTGFAADVVVDTATAIGSLVKNSAKAVKLRREATKDSREQKKTRRQRERALKKAAKQAVKNARQTATTAPPTPPVQPAQPTPPQQKGLAVVKEQEKSLATIEPKEPETMPQESQEKNALADKEQKNNNLLKEAVEDNQFVDGKIYLTYRDTKKMQKELPNANDETKQELTELQNSLLWELRDAGVVAEYIERETDNPKLKQELKQRKESFEQIRAMAVRNLNDNKIEEEREIKVKENEAKISKTVENLNYDKALDIAKKKKEKEKELRKQQEELARRIHTELMAGSEKESEKTPEPEKENVTQKTKAPEKKLEPSEGIMSKIFGRKKQDKSKNNGQNNLKISKDNGRQM